MESKFQSIYGIDSKDFAAGSFLNRRFSAAFCCVPDGTGV
jgi:hypothetical protein